MLRAQYLTLLAVISVSATLTGCNTMDLKRGSTSAMAGITSAKDTKVEFDTPSQMAVIWKDSTYSKPGATAARGFGGRVYFYNKENKPIRVNGELTVFGYDDSTDRGSKSTSADRKYVFRPDELQKHFSESDLGPSYSVWIPWDKVGGLRKTIALLPLFKTSDGVIVRSNQSINVLPGKEDPDANRVRTRHASVATSLSTGYFAESQVSHDSDATDGEAGRKNRTTTIDIPRSMANRLNQNTGFVDNRNHSAPLEPRTNNQQITQPSAQHQSSMTMEWKPVEKSPDLGESETRTRPVFGQPGAYK